jgi:hypothetical protein
MKNPTSPILAALLLTSTFAFAQTAAVTTGVETYTGNVVSVSPQSSTLVLSSEASAPPVTYSYTKETQFVDAAGNPITYEAIPAHAPVRVEYIANGDVRRVARVIVQPAAAATTTVETTTTTTRKDDDD